MKRRLMFVGLFAAIFLSGVALADEGAENSVVCDVIRTLPLPQPALDALLEALGCEDYVPPRC